MGHALNLYYIELPCLLHPLTVPIWSYSVCSTQSAHQTILLHLANVLFSLWEPASFIEKTGEKAGEREGERERLLILPLNTDIIVVLD